MYDLWELKDWHTSQKNAAQSDTAVLEPPEQEDQFPAEDVPKPFLNEYMPTPEEIRQACREIQKGWSEAERRRRRGHRRAHRQAHVLRVVRTAFAS
jgi:hypothetical protein